MYIHTTYNPPLARGAAHLSVSVSVTSISHFGPGAIPTTDAVCCPFSSRPICWLTSQVQGGRRCHARACCVCPRSTAGPEANQGGKRSVLVYEVGGEERELLPFIFCSFAASMYPCILYARILLGYRQYFTWHPELVQQGCFLRTAYVHTSYSYLFRTCLCGVRIRSTTPRCKGGGIHHSSVSPSARCGVVAQHVHGRLVASVCRVVKIGAPR